MNRVSVIEKALKALAPRQEDFTPDRPTSMDKTELLGLLRKFRYLIWPKVVHVPTFLAHVEPQHCYE